MFILKKKYFLIIENIKDINLKNIKKRNKFVIVYRNKENSVEKTQLLEFRKNCKSKSIKFYVANNLNLAVFLKSDGLYLSAYNTSFKPLTRKSFNFDIIGSAHTHKEIYVKIKQGCKTIILSKLFKVDYNKKLPFLGLIKFNYYLRTNEKLVPLGGINLGNLNSLNKISSKGFALMSEVKKKPAKIYSRLF